VQQQQASRGLLQREPLADQPAEGDLPPSHPLGIGQRGAAERLGAVPVREQFPAHDGGVDRHELAPRQVLGQRRHRLADLPPYLGGHLIEQRLLARHVPVERGCLHPKPRGQGADRETVHPSLIEDGEGGLHDRRLGQSCRHV